MMALAKVAVTGIAWLAMAVGICLLLSLSGCGDGHEGTTGIVCGCIVLVVVLVVDTVRDLTRPKR